MIPSLTPVKSRRNTLISLRTGFTYISNVTVLALALLLFATVSDPKEQFVILSLLVIGIGLTINLIFIFTIKERELTETAIESFKSM